MFFLNGINDSKISPQVSQLLTDFSSNHLHGFLPGFGETIVLPPGFLTVSSGFLAVSQSVFMEDVNDFFCLLSCFVQQGCICWKPDVLRSTGGIQNQGSLVFFFALAAFAFFLSAGSSAAGIIILVIFLFLLCCRSSANDFIVDPGKHLSRNPLTEPGHHTCIEWAFISVFPKTEEVLQVGVHGNLFGQILIRHSLVMDLDQHRTQCHSGVACSLAFLASEVIRILQIELPPGNKLAQFDPVIIRIKRQ